MKKLFIAGATGRTGRHLCQLAALSGFQTIAASRDPRSATDLPGSPLCVAADLLQPEQVDAALRETSPDAVICTVGGRGNSDADSDGVMTLVDACRRNNVRRVVLVTSLGCGDSRNYASAKLLEAIGHVLDAKTRGERHLATSGLDWTIVRPGGLLDQPANGKGTLFDDPRVHGRITCGDLASLLIGLVGQASAIGSTLSAVDTLTLSGPDDPRIFAAEKATISHAAIHE